MQPEEELPSKPDSNAFALVAQDPSSLRDLITHLQKILEAAIRRWHREPIADVNQSAESTGITSPQLTCSSDSEYDDDLPGSIVPPKRCCIGDTHGTANRPTLRDRLYSRAVRRLRLLISNLERLHSSMSLRQTELNDAQQLARLRLRKDVLAWLAKEETRRDVKSTEPTTSPETQFEQSDFAQSANLAKERAERQRRREQLRVLDDEESRSTALNSNPLAAPCVAIPTSEPAQSTCVAVGLTYQQPLYSTAIPPHRPSPMAFSWRFDKSGSPKIPIFPTKPTVSFRSPTLKGISSKLDSLTTAPTNSLHVPLRLRISPWGGCRSSKTSESAPLSDPPAASNGLTNNAPPVLLSNASTVCKSAPLPASSLSSPLRTVPTISQSTVLSNSSSTPPSVTNEVSTRKVYRVYDTLFTEDACPVRIGADGNIHFLPVDSVPLLHRQVARQMITRYKQCVHNSTASHSSSPLTKRVAVTTGDQDST